MALPRNLPFQDVQQTPVRPNWAQRAQARQPRCSASGGSALNINGFKKKPRDAAEDHRWTMNILPWTGLTMKKFG